MEIHFEKPPKFNGKHSFNIALLVIGFLTLLLAIIFILVVFYPEQTAKVLSAV